MKKKMTFEQAMNRLEEIARALESGDTPLEESIKIYEEGTELLKFCEEKLNEAAKTVKKLGRNQNGEFEVGELDGGEGAE